ncbi:MAG: SLBB domain-containing protein [Clostridia bacterium]|nr:SLBB domain-containing protein [Clostridia bacterium]
MKLQELSVLMQNAGVAGAGGAGFPSYAKLNAAADTIILNCAECEPLLKLHRQVLAKYANEILATLTVIADCVEADSIIIAVKPHYKEAVDAVKAVLPSYPKARIGLLPEVYPAGDEVVTIYETTGRVVKPGALPITVGVTVFNVETVYNIYRALHESAPVTEKYVTITGAVANPVTLLAPIGCTYQELIALAGGATVSDYKLVGGGPMTGRIVSESDVVTKTSNAIIVLPESHYVIQKKSSSIKIDMKRAMAACCQCRMCTDLCSRNLLGHPIEPHAFMRGACTGATANVAPFLGTMYCSQCGLCEMYACGQGLSPRTLIGEYKNGLRAQGVKPDPNVKTDPVEPARSGRMVPVDRLTARLGLSSYDKPAPIAKDTVKVSSVKIMLGQCIGVPAAAAVRVGDAVHAGDVVGTAAEGKLSMPVHASISGTVAEVTDKYVVIRA